MYPQLNWLQYLEVQIMQNNQIVIVEGKLRKIIHQEGQGDIPKKGQQVFALYKGTLENGTVFDSNDDRENPFNFVLGQGRVIKGWDQGFATMKQGERATLICSPEYAYGARGSPPKIPPNATLHFEVQLLSFRDKKKEKYELSDQEKLEEATKLKNNGNQLLKQGHYAGAVEEYKAGIDYLQHETNSNLKQMLNILRLNISQAYLKLNKSSDVIDNCTKVLKEEEDNQKALYRRGLAYTKNQDFERAKNDFRELIRLDPQNNEAKKELNNVAIAIKQHAQKEKKVFGSIFSKGGLYDDVQTKKQEIKPQVKPIDSQEEQGGAGEDIEASKPEQAPEATETTG